MIYDTARRGFGRFRKWAGSAPYSGLPWVVGAYVLLCCLIYTYNGPFTGHLIGFDDKVRMTQVLNLVNGADWFDRTLYRVDPPHGFASIWARIVDIPLTITVLIAQIFTDQQTAALSATVIVTLIELGVLFIVVRYAARPLVGRKNSWLVLLFLMFTSILNNQRYTFSGFHLGEASHHSWYVILYTLMIGAGARIAAGVRGRSPVLMMSLSIGLFLAVGIEGFPLISGNTIVLGLVAWLFNLPAIALRGALAVAGGALLGLLLLPMHEPPAHYLDISFAQPSILGPPLVAAAAAVLYGEHFILRWMGHSKIISLIVTAILAGILGWLLVLAFPQMLDGPAAALSPNERMLAANEHPESWSMYRATTSAAEMIGLTIPSVIAVIGAFIGCAMSRSRRRQRTYAAYMGFTLLGGVMAQVMWRYLHHAMTSASLMLNWIWLRLRRRLRRNVNYSLASLIIFVALGPFWLLFLPAIANDSPFASQVLLYPGKLYSQPVGCEPLEIADYLNSHYPKSTRLQVPDFDTATFLYHTDLTLDFLSNYPSQDRFIDNKNFFQTQDDVVAAAIASRHQFDLVTICVYLPLAPETIAARSSRDPMMMEKLAEGRPPAWLKPVYTGVPTAYRLYAVDQAALSRQLHEK